MFARNATGASDAGLPTASATPEFRPSRMPKPAPDLATAGRSVIGRDLRIIGQSLKIISAGIIQVEGEVEGDITGAEVAICEGGKVTGTVVAERVIVRGAVAGVIRGLTVALQTGAKMEGDVHHVTLAMEQGAEFEGRCRRITDPNQLTLTSDHSSAAGDAPRLARTG